MLFVGLCTACRHHRWIVSGRGSRFLLCERSRHDPAYAKYPPLPVLGCPGFEEPPRDDAATGGAGSVDAASGDAAPNDAATGNAGLDEEESP